MFWGLIAGSTNLTHLELVRLLLVDKVAATLILFKLLDVLRSNVHCSYIRELSGGVFI